MAVPSGVFPVWKNAFKIGKSGAASTEVDMVPIKEMESFSISIDGNVEEWNPFEAEGWTRRLVTGKAFTLSIAGKRHIGDEGNDYVAGLAWKSGVDCSTKMLWTFPDGATLSFDAVVNVTNIGAGETRNVGPLEFDVMSDGKPTYTAPSA